MTTAPAPATTRLGFHYGSNLRRLSDTYPRLMDVILEIVQNIHDSNARWGTITIDLKKRRLTAHDDGDGVTVEHFEKALSELGKTQKVGTTHRRSGHRTLGEFGIAIVSPVFKCRKYRFISRPRNNRSGFNEWLFESEQLIQATTIAEIPRLPRADLDQGSMLWNTMTEMEGITSDRTVTRLTLEDLEAEILDTYGVAIREARLDLTIRLTDERGFEHPLRKIIPPEFDGKKLPLVTSHGTECGSVRIALYHRHARIILPRLRLSIGTMDSDFRIPWRTFAQTHAALLDPETRQVFDSGLIEGTMLVERCKLQAERKGFVENDALAAFLIILAQWCRDTGLKLLDEERRLRKNERYQAAGVKAMNVIERFLRESTLFSELISRFRGTISGTHTPLDGKPIVGAFQSTTGRGPGSGRTYPPKTPPTTVRKNLPHLAVGGPRGHGRVSVRSETGILLEYQPLELSKKRYAFSEKGGQVIINIRHPDFAACEERDRTLTEYSALVLTWVLTLLSQAETNRGFLLHAEDTLFQAQVWQILHAGSITGHQPGRRPKASANGNN